MVKSKICNLYISPFVSERLCVVPVPRETLVGGTHFRLSILVITFFDSLHRILRTLLDFFILQIVVVVSKHDCD